VSLPADGTGTWHDTPHVVNAMTTNQQGTIRPFAGPPLAGTFGDWSLVDVIQLIDLGKKTGAVVVRGRRHAQPVEGRITFVEGALHHAREGKRDGVEAMYELFGATEGTFHFTTINDVPPRNIYLSNEHVIMEGIARQDQPCAGETADDADVLVRLVPVPHHSHRSIVLTDAQWRLVTLIQGETSLRTLARQLHVPSAQVRAMVCELAEAGLVEERVIQ
jgi:hypothetical protein